MKNFADAIDRLGTLLRYFASGFAALYVTAALVPESRTFLSSDSLIVVVLGMILGSTIYGIHTSVLARPVWTLMFWFLKKGKLTLIPDTMSKHDLQRWLRRASKEPQIQSIQQEMDKWGSMQNFLYTLSYVMILIPLIGLFYKLCSKSSVWWAILLAGCVVIIATLISEFRYTKKDIEFAVKYEDGKNS